MPEASATAFDSNHRPFTPSALLNLDRAIQCEIDAGRIPGAALLLARGDHAVYEKTWGQRRPGDPAAMTIDTIFRIYSMTKPVVSVAIMMLAEQGRLLISDPVAQHLPALANLQVARESAGVPGMVLEPAAPYSRAYLRHFWGCHASEGGLRGQRH
jgi:CubicO group peptidase (beta-lactamase class C family)